MVAFLIGGEAAFGNQLAERPRIGISQIGGGFGALVILQGRALDLFGGFEAIDFQTTFRELRFAIEGAGLDAEFCGLWLYEPRGGG